MRNYTPEEQQAAQIIKGWVETLYDNTVEGKNLGFYRGVKIGTFSHCYVGDARSAIGLSRSYADSGSPNYCSTCYKTAQDFGNAIKNQITRMAYLAMLRSFINHLKLVHHWVPNVA